MLRELAAADGDDQADVIRRDIRRIHAVRFGFSACPAEARAT
jgi:hypothetical protein